MNQITRTSIFLGAAAVSIGLAVMAGMANRPNENVGSYEVGTKFFPDFDDPLAATALQVAAFDEEAGRVNVFKVEKRNGIWRIPSHYNYPADGEERLAKTATSMMGVERGALVSTSSADHKRYDLLDPLNEEASGTEGYGDHITLFQDDGKLLDLIVGKKVEDQTDVYYVRKPGENQVYRAKLGTVDLSTKFADWIKQDVLQVNSSDLVEMVVNPYHIDEVQGLRVQDEDPILLERKPATSSWRLEGIDETQEKEKVSVINAMSRALADLKIVDVRPKPDSLIALFRGEQDVRLTTREMAQMQAAGFFVIPPGDFVANEGEVQAGTKEGVRYRLQFGEVFTGTDVEIELGSNGEESADESAENEAATSDDESEDDATDPSQQRNRYLFVSVVFDESLLGDRPEAPVPPTPPADEPAAETNQDNSEPPAGDAPQETSDDGAADTASDGESAADEAETADTDRGGAAADEADDSGADEAAPTDADAAENAGAADNADDTPTPQEIYEQEQAAYETALEQYETALAAYEEKVEAGRKKSEELNQRFAEWYYVISADQYEDLKVSRSDLVEPAEPEDSDAATGGPDLGSLLQGQPQGDSPADSSDDGAAPANGSTPNDNAPESSSDNAAPGEAASEGDAPASETPPAESSESPDEPAATASDSSEGSPPAAGDSDTDEGR